VTVLQTSCLTEPGKIFRRTHVLYSFFIAWAVAVLLGTPVSIPLQASGQDAGRAEPQASNPNVHFEGCVFPEAALNSATPIVPSTSTAPYVLTNVKVISGVIKDEEAAKTTYTLTTATADELRSLYGKRVGVVGRVNQAGQTPTRPNLDVVSIREISGGCPTVPTLPSAP